MERSKIVVLAAVLALAIALLAPAGSSAWAPAKSATVHPGVQVFTEGAQCTANFVFEEGSSVYLGQAAHCSGTGGQTETDGCTSGSLPLGTPVEVTGASKPGTLVYNSWLAMQANGETDPDTCAYNDLALIKIDPADVGSVNPSVPGFGGPTGVGGVGGLGSTVYSYGNSSSSARCNSHPCQPPTGSATSTKSSPTCAPTAASAQCSWCRAPSRSNQTWWKRSSAHSEDQSSSLRRSRRSSGSVTIVISSPPGERGHSPRGRSR